MMLVVVLLAGFVGAVGGFLLFNFNPAVIFLGDSGSLFLGFAIGMLAVKASLKSHAAFFFLVPLLALGLPVMDAVVATVRRFLTGLPVSTPDRRHVHHRLSDWGLSHKQVVIVLGHVSYLLSNIIQFRFQIVGCTALEDIWKLVIKPLPDQ